MWTASATEYENRYKAGLAESLNTTFEKITIDDVYAGSTVVKSGVAITLSPTQLAAFQAQNFTQAFILVFQKFVADGGNPADFTVSNAVVAPSAASHSTQWLVMALVALVLMVRETL